MTGKDKSISLWYLKAVVLCVFGRCFLCLICLVSFPLLIRVVRGVRGVIAFVGPVPSLVGFALSSSVLALVRLVSLVRGRGSMGSVRFVPLLVAGRFRFRFGLSSVWLALSGAGLFFMCCYSHVQGKIGCDRSLSNKYHN